MTAGQSGSAAKVKNVRKQTYICDEQYRIQVHDKDKQRREYLNNNNKGKINRG